MMKFKAKTLLSLQSRRFILEAGYVTVTKAYTLPTSRDQISRTIELLGCEHLLTKTKVNDNYKTNSRYLSTTNHSFTKAKQVDKTQLPHIDPKFSYVYGRSTKQLKYENLAQLFDQALEREKQTTACVFYDEGIVKSFEDLNDDVNRLVNGFVDNLNLKLGDRIGIYAFNSYQWVLTQYACNKLGLQLFAINPAYKPDELAYMLSKSNLKVLFMPGKNSSQQSLNNHWEILKSQEIQGLELLNLTDIVIFEGELEKNLPLKKGVKFSLWSDVISRNAKLSDELHERLINVSPDSTYGVYQTSGTTGYPKGAVISQFTAINNTKLGYERLFNQREPEFSNIRHNICLPLPLFHEFAGVLGILAPFCNNGGSYVITGIKYDIESVVKAVQRFNCNVIFLTPTILIDLLDYVDKKKVRNLPIKMIAGAGSMVLPELVERTYKTLPDLEQFKILYGSSEHGVLATIQSNNEPIEMRPYTVGSPLDFCEVRIADLETNQTKLMGESGEVQTRGFNTMVEYFNDPQKTADTILESRWFKTGDMGVINKQYGTLHIVGRMKDLIIKGGENVYPAEVERVLHLHEAINDAQVFGIPDSRYGEEVCVWIKLNESFKLRQDFNELQTMNEISEFCKQKLAYFKVPKPKFMRFVDSFPLTAVKKIKKYEMRDKMIEYLDQTEKKEKKG